MFKQGIDKKPTWQSTCQEVAQAGRGKEIEKEWAVCISGWGKFEPDNKMKTNVKKA